MPTDETSSRDERRRKAKVDERRRQEELDKLLDEPPLKPFEAPPSGIIVENPPRPPKPR